MDLNLAAAWFAIGKLSSETAVAAASDALDRGLYCDQLALLTCSEPIWSEVGPLFTAALDELGIKPPSGAVAIQIIAREYARAILTGEVTPHEGAKRIWWDLTLEPDAPESLRVFSGLASEWEDLPQLRSQLEADIIAEARRLVSESDN